MKVGRWTGAEVFLFSVNAEMETDAALPLF
jgi:hypothetical protein